MSAPNFNRFLNMNSTILTTDNIVVSPPYFYASASGALFANSATPSNTANQLVMRGGGGSVSVGNLLCPKLTVNGNSKQYIRQNIGTVLNNATFTLPSGNWGGHIWLNYGNDSGRVALRKYAFRKNAGGTGFMSQLGTAQDLYHFFVGSTDSSITFNASTGVFTIVLGTGSGNVSANAFIEMFQV
jgi:hypothetical protein